MLPPVRLRLLGLTLASLSAPPSPPPAAPPRAWAEPMEFTVQRSDFREHGFGLHFLLYGSGDIEPGTVARLRAFVDRNRVTGGIVTLYLNSPGGSLAEGMSLG